MANAFCIASCPRSTLQDFVAITELCVVDKREHDRVFDEYKGNLVKEVKKVGHRHLQRHIPMMDRLQREGKLLPLKFDAQFYE